MIGHLRDLSRSRDGEWIVSFSTPEDIRELYDELAGKPVVVDLKKYSKRRSMEANRYCWVLVDQIAAKLNITKQEVYRQAIRDIGGVSDVVGVREKAVDAFRRSWEKNGLGWMTDILPSKREGWSNVVVYYGSSCYDQTQMHRLITNLVQDAEALGIPTITPEEERRMLAQWGKKREGKKNDQDGSRND